MNGDTSYECQCPMGYTGKDCGGGTEECKLRRELRIIAPSSVLACSQPSIFSLGVKPAHRRSRENWTLGQKGEAKGEGRRDAARSLFPAFEIALKKRGGCEQSSSVPCASSISFLFGFLLFLLRLEVGQRNAGHELIQRIPNPAFLQIIAPSFRTQVHSFVCSDCKYRCSCWDCGGWDECGNVSSFKM